MLSMTPPTQSLRLGGFFLLQFLSDLPKCLTPLYGLTLGNGLRSSRPGVPRWMSGDLLDRRKADKLGS